MGTLFFSWIVQDKLLFSRSLITSFTISGNIYLLGDQEISIWGEWLVQPTTLMFTLSHRWPLNPLSWLLCYKGKSFDKTAIGAKVFQVYHLYFCPRPRISHFFSRNPGNVLSVPVHLTFLYRPLTSSGHSSLPAVAEEHCATVRAQGRRASWVLGWLTLVSQLAVKYGDTWSRLANWGRECKANRGKNENSKYPGYPPPHISSLEQCCPIEMECEPKSVNLFWQPLCAVLGHFSCFWQPL